jgi:excisionase family DNA binding protein
MMITRGEYRLPLFELRLKETKDMEEDLITLAEVAKLIGVSRTMIHYLIASRDLPARRFGPKAWLVRRVDAERLKEKRTQR